MAKKDKTSIDDTTENQSNSETNVKPETFIEKVEEKVKEVEQEIVTKTEAIVTKAKEVEHEIVAKVKNIEQEIITKVEGVKEEVVIKAEEVKQEVTTKVELEEAKIEEVKQDVTNIVDVVKDKTFKEVFIEAISKTPFYISQNNVVICHSSPYLVIKTEEKYFEIGNKKYAYAGTEVKHN